MKNPVSWTITVKICGRYERISCVSKKEAIRRYLDFLNAPWFYNISELKIYKDNIEYTRNINRFLED